MTRQPHRLKLSGELGLRDADAVREQLIDALFVHPSVEVDTQDLTGIDMSIVQILIAAHKLAKTRNQQFQICARENSPLQNALSRAGLLRQSTDAPLEIHWQERGAA